MKQQMLKFLMLLLLVTNSLVGYAELKEDIRVYLKSDMVYGLEKSGGEIIDKQGAAVTLKAYPNGAIDIYKGGRKICNINEKFTTMTVYIPMIMKGAGYKTVQPGSYAIGLMSGGKDILTIGDRDMYKRRLNRWAGHKLPSKFDKVTKKNIYLGATIDYLDMRADLYNDLWQPTNLPEIEGVSKGKLLKTWRYRVNGVTYTVYMLSDGVIKSGKKYVKEIYLVPDGYKRVFKNIPLDKYNKDEFYWGDAINKPLCVQKLVLHCKGHEAYLSAIVYEDVYDSGSESSQGYVYEIPFPDEIGEPMLSYVYQGKEICMSEKKWMLGDVEDYTLMPKQKAKSMFDAQMIAKKYYGPNHKPSQIQLSKAVIVTADQSSKPEVSEQASVQQKSAPAVKPAQSSDQPQHKSARAPRPSKVAMKNGFPALPVGLTVYIEGPGSSGIIESSKLNIKQTTIKYNNKNIACTRLGIKISYNNTDKRGVSFMCYMVDKNGEILRMGEIPDSEPLKGCPSAFGVPNAGCFSRYIFYYKSAKEEKDLDEIEVGLIKYLQGNPDELIFVVEAYSADGDYLGRAETEPYKIRSY